MKIEKTKTEKLIPYTWNNKIHTAEQIHSIANSIKRFGFLVPIVIDEDNIILSGHGRYEAAKLLKQDTVPTHKVSGLSEAEKKAYRIVDNKTAADTGYEMANIELELAALTEAGFPIEEFKLDDLTFDAPEDPEEETKPEAHGGWLGQIKIKVSAEEIDSFEDDLGDLLKKYNSATMEIKRAK